MNIDENLTVFHRALTRKVGHLRNHLAVPISPSETYQLRVRLHAMQDSETSDKGYSGGGHAPYFDRGRFQIELYCAPAISRKDEAMHVLTTATDTLTTLPLSGPVDFASRKTLQSLLDAGMANGQRDFALDLYAVTSMDSSGLGALVACLSAVRQQGGSLRLTQVPGQVQELIDMAQLTGFFNV